MQLVETRAEAEFRTELRAWLADTLSSLPPAPDRDDWPARRAFDTAWQRRLFDAGYAGIAWPAEYGGRGASPSEELIFLSETERAGAPCVGCNFVGTLHAGPTITAEGTADQNARYLSGILRGEDVWCQGFSEPGSGSDLASLRTRAVRDGDSFVVLGHKIWTSHAQVADFCELLVRTDPDQPRHGGISWLIMPMDLPGIEIQPLRTITGVSEFNEVFLDEVRIPVENLVGAENDGWRVAMVTFSFERGTAFVSELLGSIALAEDLVRIAVANGSWDDGAVRSEVAVIAHLDTLWGLTRRNVSAAAVGVAGVGGSVFKLGYHEARTRLGRVTSASSVPSQARWTCRRRCPADRTSRRSSTRSPCRSPRARRRSSGTSSVNGSSASRRSVEWTCCPPLTSSRCATSFDVSSSTGADPSSAALAPTVPCLASWLDWVCSGCWSPKPTAVSASVVPRRRSSSRSWAVLPCPVPSRSLPRRRSSGWGNRGFHDRRARFARPRWHRRARVSG